MKAIMKILHSMFSDKDWDADVTKIGGFLLAVCGVIGFFCSIPEWSIMLIIGTGAMLTGKFSKEG